MGLGNRSNNPILRRVLAILYALGLVAALAGVFNLSAPVKAAGLVLACGLGLWLHAIEADGGETHRTDLWNVALVLSLALAAGFIVAWHEERPSTPHSYAYVVNPDPLGLESVAPAPKTEIIALGQHPYGDQVQVSCFTLGANQKRWYHLRDGNFMPAHELVRAPLSQGTAPAC